MWNLLQDSDGSVLELSGWAVLLVVLIGAVVWLIFRIRAWYWGDEDPAAADHAMLTRIGELHREGDLTEEEYRSIKSRLIERFDGTSSESPPHNQTESAPETSGPAGETER